MIYGYHLLNRGFKEGDIIDLTRRGGGIVKGPIRFVREGSLIIVDNAVRNGGLFTVAKMDGSWVNSKILGINSLTPAVKLPPVEDDKFPNYRVIFTYVDQHGINRREQNTFTGTGAYEKAQIFMAAKIGMQNDAPIDAIWIEQVFVINYVDTTQAYPVVN